MSQSILKVEYKDEKTKVEALKKVARSPGVASITIEEEGKMVIFTGNADPVTVTNRLRKLCGVTLISHGPIIEDDDEEDEESDGESPRSPVNYDWYYPPPPPALPYYYRVEDGLATDACVIM